MLTNTSAKESVATGDIPELLQGILTELRLLRKDLAARDDLEEYAHPDRIRQSYKKALRQHPLDQK